MTVEDTLRIAIDALGGQKDLAGAPAILHALAVGLMGQNELEQKVGFLHDVVEDSDLTIENLREMGVEEDVLQAVDLLTGNIHDFGGGSELPPYSSAIWKMER